MVHFKSGMKNYIILQQFLYTYSITRYGLEKCNYKEKQHKHLKNESVSSHTVSMNFLLTAITISVLL